MPGGKSLRVVSLVVRVVAGVLVVGIAVGIAGALVGSKPEAKRLELGELALDVEVFVAREEAVSRTWEGYGTVRAMDRAELSAQVSARVVARGEGIEDGARVSRGDVIVRLEEDDARRRLESAQATQGAVRAQLDQLDVDKERFTEQVRLAREERDVQQREYERARSAAERGAGNETEVEQRLATLRRVEREVSTLEWQLATLGPSRERLESERASAEAQERLAALELERTTIAAPFDGVVERVAPRAGDLVMVGTPVAQVVGLSRFEVPLRVPARALAEVGVGDDAEVWAELPGGARTSLPGVVTRVGPTVDEATRTGELFVEVAQHDGVLRPGMFVMGRVSSRARAPRLVVPRGSVERDHALVVGEGASGEGASGEDGLGESVFVARDRRAKALFALDASAFGGEAGEEWVALDAERSDVRAGDRVIVSGLDRLIDGSRVRVVGGE
jgi:multidrug efflux pump subunit AcrA (membrane-fusion protein)